MIRPFLILLLPLTTLFNRCGQTQNPNHSLQGKNVNNSTVDYSYEKYTIKTGNGTGSVEIADFNKDGHPDIVVANSSDASISIFFNDGSGKFSESNSATFPCNSSPNDIAIADFNKDNSPDLAIANNEMKQLSLLLGNGKGAFNPSPYSPFIVRVKPHTHSVATGDFNNDDNLDLVTESWAVDSVVIIFGNGMGNFNSPRYFKVGKRPYQRVRVADLNKDKYADIVTTNLEGNNCTVLLCDGKGNFSEPKGSPFSCGDAPFGVVIGDINGDSNPDLIIADAPTITSESKGKDGLFILLGDVHGEFTPLHGSPFATGKSPSRLAIGDIDGNGISDIAVTNYNDQSISIYFMNENGIPSFKTIIAGRRPDGIALHDLNADGKGDIIVGNFDDNTINIFISK